MQQLYTCILCVFLVVGCTKTQTQPQRPRVLGEEHLDTTMMQMIDLNQRMASEADLCLSHYVDQGYVLMETNYWVKGLKQETDTLCSEEYIELEAAFYTLSDSLVMVHNAQCTVEKVDEIQAISHVIRKMHHGQSVSLIVPWYLAFGSAGNAEVQPYENLRVELTIK